MSLQLSADKVPCFSETEEALLRRPRQGDHEAFQQLVEQYHGALIRIAMMHVSDWGVAQDVVQETWLAALQRAGEELEDRLEGIGVEVAA